MTMNKKLAATTVVAIATLASTSPAIAAEGAGA